MNLLDEYYEEYVILYEMEGLDKTAAEQAAAEKLGFPTKVALKRFIQEQKANDRLPR